MPRLNLGYANVHNEGDVEFENVTITENSFKTYKSISIRASYIYNHFTFDLTYNKITDSLNEHETDDLLIEESFVLGNCGYMFN